MRKSSGNVQSWRYLSLLVGVGLLLLAISLAVLAKPSVIAPRLLHAVTDMGADSCLQCHRAAHQEWYPAAYTLQPEADAYAAISGLEIGTMARPGELSDTTRAYTLDDVHLPMSAPDSGSQAALPESSDVLAFNDWLGNCVACHQPLRGVIPNRED